MEGFEKLAKIFASTAFSNQADGAAGGLTDRKRCIAAIIKPTSKRPQRVGRVIHSPTQQTFGRR
ncbi:hypothetical protein ACEN9J_34710 [Variovorax sp. Varisp41]|uniref:hypothetical protein n=1 Tax=Variovorax sp. Varisp41 TaxID=3243033 RepID=UPI0039B57BC1